MNEVNTAERLAGRAAMHNANALKIGFFGTNCSSGRTLTLLEERWSGNWEDNLRFAQLADEAGIDFLLPIGRWKGYGGPTDYQGTTFETLTWATALLAHTRRITVFGTVHAPLFHPLIAAKQIVTADHVSRGRIGLNIVCGWNEGEFEMFGVGQREHEERYRQGREWLEVIKLAWERDDFDYAGEFFNLRGVREKPKPYGGVRPIVMNAGSSPTGRAFALRNCDAFFTGAPIASWDDRDLGEAAAMVASAKAEARANGRDNLDVYTVGVVICRPTRRETEDYLDHLVANADWSLIEKMIPMFARQQDGPDRDRMRRAWVTGYGGIKLFGDPDDVAAGLAGISRAGFTGIAVNFVHYLDEFPIFRDEVLPRLERLGVRVPVRG